MSILIDEITQLIEDSVENGEATRHDWQGAIDRVFGNKPLDPLEAEASPDSYLLTWEIDQDAKTAAGAAVEVWKQVFRRGPWQPNSGDACVFTVTGPGGRTAQVDLADERFTHLFR